MRRGFIFDEALCVSCKACSAACILENGLQPGTRSLYAWNDHALPLVSVINLSMACNHCAEPACASGCPALAYSVSPDGVVMHHPDLCMGCGYCTWRCPYDAPKINPALGYIEKCHFCADRTAEGIEPACVTACPTGALKMTVREQFDGALPAWFPETGIGPSLITRETAAKTRPVIIPADSGEDEEEEEQNRKAVPERIRKDWSLILFSMLVITASSLLIVSSFQSLTVAAIIPILLLTGAMAVSVIHLGKPGRSWRAFLNIISSPLSREILIVMLLAVVALVHWIRPGLIPPFATVLISVLTVISIDLVYFSTDRRTGLRLNAGQAFFTTLYAVSWFSAPRIIFIAFTMLAAFSIVMRYRSAERGSIERILYYIRAMTIPLVLLLIYPESPLADTAAMVLFLAGLAADRILFYFDFNPPNIKDTIKEHFNTEYEKERDKQRQDPGLS
jgi:Fe-S-cluster-containing dehydrogenase component